MPFLHQKFGYFYGFGNFDTLFYLFFPTYILLKFNHCSILRRLGYSAFFMLGYTCVKLLYTEDFRHKSKYFVKSCLL